MTTKSMFFRFIGVAALGLALLPSAHATIDYAGQYTFLGDFTVPPAAPNSESFTRDQNQPIAFPTGAFDDYYIFTINPAATGQLSVNFVPIGAITGFMGGLYNASGFTGCTVGATCTPGTIGTMIKEAAFPQILVGIQGSLAAGQYAVRVQGNNTSTQTSYTGQVAFLAVPEPGTLALFGMGLLGLGLARRRVV